MHDRLEPGLQVRLLSGVTATVVEDPGEPLMVLVRLADGELVRTTHAALEVAALRASQAR